MRVRTRERLGAVLSFVGLLAVLALMCFFAVSALEAQTKVVVTVGAGDSVIVIGAGVTPPPPASHEPAGMVAQINTGAITAAPSCSSSASSWTVAGKAWSMFSTTTTSGTGENCGNLQLVGGGHSGYRVVYPANVKGGNSPARFGTGFASSGTGWLYLRWRGRLESGWTTNGNFGVKLMEPRTPNQGTGPTLQNDVVGANKNASNADGWLQFLQQGSATTNIPPFQYTAPYTVPQPFYKDSAANIGAQHAGQWHTIEYLIQPNSPLTAANGCFTLWVDSALEYTGCTWAFFAAGNTAAWNYLMFDPTYGGGTASPPAAGVAWDFDSLYVSVK